MLRHVRMSGVHCVESSTCVEVTFCVPYILLDNVGGGMRLHLTPSHLLAADSSQLALYLDVWYPCTIGHY